MKKFLKSFLLFTCIILSACSEGASNFPVPDGNQPLFKLTGTMAAMSSSDDNMTGTLDVYDTTVGERLITEDLTINDSGVSAPIFTLTRNTEYRFVIIFYWKNVAIAYVNTIQTTDNDDSTDIRFTEDMIVYTTIDSSSNEGLSADISSGVLPNLDSDGDTYPNFVEFRAGTDPNDYDDQPTHPTIENFQTLLVSNTLQITANLSDDLEISDAELTFGQDNYLSDVLSVSLLEMDKKHKTFQGTLDPHYAPVGEVLTLTLTVTNSIGLTTTATLNYTVENTVDTHPTIIDFESAETGEILGGEVTLLFRAYDDDGVDSVTIGQPLGLINDSSASDRFIGRWNTTTVSNGTYNIRVTATDSAGKIFTQLFPVQISNGRDRTGPEITLSVFFNTNLTSEIDYQNGEVASGLVTLYAWATDDPSGVSTLYLANEASLSSALGAPLSPNPPPYVRTLDTTELSDGTNTLQFVAIDHAGNRRTTTFSLTVGNTPTINSFTVAGAINGVFTVTSFAGNEVTFTWDAENADTYTIKNPDGDVIASGNAANGSATLENLLNSGTYTLTLTHVTNNGAFEQTSSITINVDEDGDGLTNEEEYFIYGSNLLDSDSDDDGLSDGYEVHTTGTYPGTSDSDEDGVDDAVDIFPVDSTETIDSDDDGTGDNADCDDVNPNINPDATEVLNGIDDDCDGTIDYFSLSLADTRFLSENNQLVIDPDEGAGSSVTSVGDVNGDGYEDLLISDAGQDNGSLVNVGAVYLIYGPLNVNGSVNLASADAKFIAGDLSRTYPLISAAKAGDVDGDGYDDILIVSQEFTQSDSSYSSITYLIYGQAAKWSGNKYLATVGSSIPGSKFIGAGNSSSTIAASSSGGDVNGDGYSDILISDPHDFSGGPYAGAVYLIYGASSRLNGNINLSRVGSSTDNSISGAKFIGENTYDSLLGEMSVSNTGDINGDGHNDILIGVYRPSHVSSTDFVGVYLIYGRGGSNELTGSLSLENADAKFTDVNFNLSAWHTYFVSSNGDVNNDGKDDILISGKGKIFLMYGRDDNNLISGTIDMSVADANFIDVPFGQGLGFFPSSVGDVNADGHDDILMGSVGAGMQGQFYLIYGDRDLLSGTIDLSSANAQFVGEERSTITMALSNAGDMNGDGKNDICIGIAGVLTGVLNEGEQVGAVYLILSHFGE